MRWLLLCLFLLKASAHTVELNNMFGQIQSPGYPDSYPSDSEVTWNITVPEGFRIKLYFMHFNLESSYLCEYDYVKVETEDQVLATFCGREATDTEQTPGQEVVLSPGSFMSVTFRSDFSNEERFTGFDAHYMAVGYTLGSPHPRSHFPGALLNGVTVSPWGYEGLSQSLRGSKGAMPQGSPTHAV